MRRRPGFAGTRLQCILGMASCLVTLLVLFTFQEFIRHLHVIFQFLLLVLDRS